MKANLSQIKAAAEKATPGPWYVDKNDRFAPDEVYGILTDAGILIVETDAGVYPPRLPDAEHIAQANPEAVLAHVTRGELLVWIIGSFWIFALSFTVKTLLKK